MRILVENFDLKLSVLSGQPINFIYKNLFNNKNIICIEYKINDKNLIIEQKNKNEINIKGSYSKLREFVISEFRLDDDLGKIISTLSKDKILCKIIALNRGLRLTKHNPWETAICFVSSQRSSIKKTRKTIQNLIQLFNGFPTPNQILKAGNKKLNACGFGYRTDYIIETAKYFSNRKIEEIEKLTESELKSELMGIHGIGPKVSDCILLYGFGFVDIFPIDIWIKRVMEKLYFNNNKKSLEEIQAFAKKRWGNLSGYAQLYLYKYALDYLK